MADPLVIPNGVRVVCKGTIAGRQCVNTFGVTSNGQEQNSTNMLTIANIFKNWWDVSVQPLVTDAHTLTEVSATALGTAYAPQATVTASLTGTKANSQPPNIAQCINFTTATRAPFARGRVFLPPPGDGDVNSSGQLLAQQVTDLTTAMTALQNSLLTDTTPLAVLSRSTLTAYVVTGTQVETLVSTQRRRLRP